MKRLLAPTFALFVACGSPRAPAPARASQAAEIARVEAGLLPEIRVEGAKVEWSIAERMQFHHTPGVSIAVIHDYDVVWAKAYGVADGPTKAPLTEATLLQAASVSKMFAAVTALKAVENEKLTLDGDVNETLKSWKLPTKDATITLRQLLSHTAATNVRSFPGYLHGEPIPSPTDILAGKPPAKNAALRVEGQPGREYSYSGGGYELVAMMLADAHGRPYAEVVKETVFAPFGLAHSTLDLPPRAPFASGHDFDASVVPGRYRIQPEAAGAGLWSTPSDIARVLVEVQRALAGRSKLMSTTLARRLTTPVISIGTDDTVQMALGTYVEKHDGVEYFGHDGFNEGFLTISRATKSGGDGAVVMVNGLSGGPLILEIFRSIAATYGWQGWLPAPVQAVRLDPKRLASFAGRYRFGVDRPLTVIVTGDRLQAVEPLRPPFELVPVGENTFVSPTEGQRFVFGPNDATVTQVGWPPRGTSETLVRRPDEEREPIEMLAAGLFEEALAAYQKTSPTDASVSESRLRHLAEEQLERRLDARTAVRLCEVNLALHPDSGKVFADLADALLHAGRRPEATAAYRRAETLLAQDTKPSETDRTYYLWKMSRLRARGILPR